MNREELVETVTKAVLEHFQQRTEVPVGIANRHVHLSPDDLVRLSGEKVQLTKWKDLSQPGQYACEEKVVLVGPKGIIEQVRVLGPTRAKTQVEVSVTDCFKLGVIPEIRQSGDLEGTPGIVLVGKLGAVTLKEGCIVAARHLHVSSEEAKRYGLKDKDKISVQSHGLRSVVFHNVLVRVHDNYRLELHLDFDEANGACLRQGDLLEIIR